MGTILPAIVQWLAILRGPLYAIFEQLTPASENLPFLVPTAVAYDLVFRLHALGWLGLLASFALGLSVIGEVGEADDEAVGPVDAEPRAVAD